MNRATRTVLAVSAVVGAAAVGSAGCSSSDDRPAPQPDLVFASHSPAPTPARSFGSGSYVVGQDVEPGRYSAGSDPAACRWVQRDSSGQVLDRSGDARPTQVLTLTTRGSSLVVAGSGCRFERIA